MADVTVPNGCPCKTSSACTTALSSVSAECVQSVNTILCEQAAEIEATFNQNIRGLFHHIANDCGTFSLTCPGVPPFNTATCGAVPPPPAEPTPAPTQESAAPLLAASFLLAATVLAAVLL